MTYIKNRLKDVVKHPDSLEDSIKAITHAIEAQFDKPVSIGIVVALAGGDVYDAMACGTMDPQVMEMCLNTINHAEFEAEIVHRREGAARPAKDNNAPDCDRPANIPAKIWAQMPAELKALLRGEDVHVLAVDGDDFDELIQHKGSLGGFDED